MHHIKNKEILIAFYDVFERCPRPKRFFSLLSKKNQVTVLSKSTRKFNECDTKIVYKTLLSPFILVIQFIAHKLGLISISSAIESSKYRCELDDDELKKFDLIIVHDLVLLGLFKNHLDRVVFDAREYYPNMFGGEKEFNQWSSKIYKKWCHQYLNKIKLKVTISESIAELYKSVFFASFMSLPSYPLRKFIDLSKPHGSEDRYETIKLIHHGVALPDRKIEKLIKLAELLGPKYELNLMLVKINSDYFNKISLLIEEQPNIKLLKPVEFERIIPFISQYHIGVHFLEGHNDQHPFCLPNKFFEFVAAGLMLIVGGSKEMVKYTRKYNLGFSYPGSTDIQNIADDIKRLKPEEIEEYKSRCLEVSPNFTFEEAFQQVEASIMKIYF